MRNTRIYTSQPLTINAYIELSANATNHVTRVLRMKIGEPLILFNSEYGSFQGTITIASKKKVCVFLQSVIENNSESPLRIELGQVVSRGERMDYAIQKATEVGISAITPLFSERCEVKLNPDRQEKKVHHWQQLAISACEQSGRNKVPVIHKPTPVLEWLKDRSTNLNFVLFHQSEKRLNGYDKPSSVSLLIGPEGGLTPDEIAQARTYRFHSLRIGPRILRTETAPIAAACIMNYIWGDLN